MLRAITTDISSSYTPNLLAYTQAFATNNPNYAAAIAVVLAIGTFILSFGFLKLVQRRGAARDGGKRVRAAARPVAPPRSPGARRRLAGQPVRHPGHRVHVRLRRLLPAPGVVAGRLLDQGAEHPVCLARASGSASCTSSPT